MTPDRVRRRLRADRLAGLLRLETVRRELQPDRLRRRVRENPWLTALLVVAAILTTWASGGSHPTR